MIDLSLYQKTCPGCDVEYQAKRINQVFCTPSCKSRFHNFNQRQKRLKEKSVHEITGDIHKILWNNRQILKEHCDQEISLDQLKSLGFKTNFITQFTLKKEHHNVFYCYDYAYEFINNKLMKISKL